MAYTFGAGVTDNISSSGLNSSLFTTNRMSLVCCWVKPSTLTATRVLWSTSAIYALSIDTTTTSLRLTLDGATTDGTYIAPMGLATGTWTFVAFAWCMGATPTAAARAWSATETSGPVEQTVTPTAASGAWASGGSTFTLGNTPAGSLAFQGDIGGLVAMVDSQPSNLNTMCSIDCSSGAITQSQADALRSTFVVPAWKGDIGSILGMGRQIINPATQLGFALAMSLDNGTAGGAWSQRAGQANARATVTGATSSGRTPRSFDDQYNNSMMRRGGVFLGTKVRS